MKWTVIYRPDAADELATIWIDSSDRQAVADAANAIDKQLAADPSSAGKSRDRNSRILCEGPLAVFFDINESDRIVSVWGVSHR